MLEAQTLGNMVNGIMSPTSARFRTQDRDECVTYVRNTSIGHSMKPNGCDPLSFAHWNVCLDSVDIDMVEVGCEFSIDRGDVDDRYYVHMPLGGMCEIGGGKNVVMAQAGHIFALNPSSLAHKRWVGGCKQIMVRIDRQGIERIMADELGVECYAPLDFELVMLDGERNTALAQFLISYWKMFAAGAGMHQKQVAKSLERGLVSGLLAILPHNYSAELQRPTAGAAPYYVRRAIEYIHANVRNEIAPQDLVAAAGVSARSLYYGFRRWRGTTPMVYLRNVRLSLARKELEEARSTGRSVTEIAMNVGYEHLSRFSKDYRDKYGELPSATLRG
ncbi:MAG: AraC family transcriptional regulator [Sphingomonadales bacterium]